MVTGAAIPNGSLCPAAVRWWGEMMRGRVRCNVTVGQIHRLVSHTAAEGQVMSVAAGLACDQGIGHVWR